jgi:hypothetical protein
MSTSNEPGEVLWDAPVPKPVSRWILAPVAAVLIAMGCMFIWAGAYSAWHGGEMFILVIGFIGGAILLAIGGAIVYSAFLEIKLLKIRLCQHGLDFETNRGRRFVRYSELESIRYVEEDLARQDMNKKLAVGKLALSILAANAPGASLALGTMMAQRIAGVLLVKATEMREIGVVVPVDVAERLAKLFEAIAVPK